MTNAQPIRILAIGAHPDDCDLCAGGTAALWADLGHAVKFVSVANGDAGHHVSPGAALADRRRLEAKEAGRRLGVTYDVLNNHDGQILPTLAVREQIIREIRLWKADLVLTPRPNDYHPDHRYTSMAVQDAAYMVVVPALVPDAPALRKNPVFAYYEDRFQRPNPFRPDVAVVIDSVIDKKIDALDAHVSQFYEWLPWVDNILDQVPENVLEREAWLKARWPRVANAGIREAVSKWYGAETAKKARYYEAFEICEYGAQPDSGEIRRLFPMLR